MIIFLNSDMLAPTNTCHKKIFWNDRSVNDENSISILDYIDEHALIIRSKCLKYLYDIGYLEFNDVSASSMLKIAEDFSFWEMTLIAEQSVVSKAPQIEELVKLIALDHLCEHSCAKSIEITDAVFSQRVSLIYWANHKGYKLCVKYKTLSLFFHNIRESQIVIVNFAKVLLFTLTLLFNGSWKRKTFEATAPYTLVNYLFATSPYEVSNATIPRAYWGNLPDKIVNNEKEIKWLHIWVPSKTLPNIRCAEKYVERLNANNEKQKHVLVNNWRENHLIITSFLCWVRLSRATLKLILNRKYSKDICGAYKIIIYKVILNSIYTPAAIDNLLFFHTFKKLITAAKVQRYCLYLYENQGWEAALRYHWSRNGLDNIVGVAHATVRFWDLRYHLYADSWVMPRKFPPSKIAVNGNYARRSLLGSGIEENMLVDTEALRYSHLIDHRYGKPRKDAEPFIVLILTDGLPLYTNYQVKLIDEASKVLNSKYKFILKAHPNCLVQKEDFQFANVEILDCEIGTAISMADIAITSETTGAALEAYISGIPILSTLRNAGLNFSPLYGSDRVRFVSDTTSLNSALESVVSEMRHPHREEFDYFNISNQLPLWERILDIHDE